MVYADPDVKRAHDREYRRKQRILKDISHLTKDDAEDIPLLLESAADLGELLSYITEKVLSDNMNDEATVRRINLAQKTFDLGLKYYDVVKFRRVWYGETL